MPILGTIWAKRSCENSNTRHLLDIFDICAGNFALLIPSHTSVAIWLEHSNTMVRIEDSANLFIAVAAIEALNHHAGSKNVELLEAGRSLLTDDFSRAESQSKFVLEQENTGPTERLFGLLFIGLAQISNRTYDKALEAAELGISLASNVQAQATVPFLLLLAGRAAAAELRADVTEHDSDVKILREAIKLSAENDEFTLYGIVGLCQMIRLICSTDVISAGASDRLKTFARKLQEVGKVNPPLTARLLQCESSIAFADNQPAEAYALVKDAYALVEAHYGRHHSYSVELALDLANAAHAMDRTEEAMHLVRDAIATEQLSNCDNLRLAKLHHRLGLLECDMQTAFPAFWKALELYQAVGSYYLFEQLKILAWMRQWQLISQEERSKIESKSRALIATIDRLRT